MRLLVVEILISASLFCQVTEWIYVKAHILKFKGWIIAALIVFLLYHAWSSPGMVWLGLVWFGLAKNAETALLRPHMGENA